MDCESELLLLGVSTDSFLGVTDAGAAAVDGGLDAVLGGEPPVAYCLRSSSHRARRSWRSWFGRRRLRAGAGVLGVHVTPAWGGERLLDGVKTGGRSERGRGSRSQASTKGAGGRVAKGAYLDAIAAWGQAIALDLAMLAEDAGQHSGALVRLLLMLRRRGNRGHDESQAATMQAAMELCVDERKVYVFAAL